MAAALSLIGSRAVSDIALITTASLSLCPDAPLTLCPPIWHTGVLPRSGGRSYVLLIVSFRIHLVKARSINYLPLKSRCISAPPLTILHLLKCSLPVSLLGSSMCCTGAFTLTLLCIWSGPRGCVRLPPPSGVEINAPRKDLDPEVDWDLLDTPPPVVIDIRSSMQDDFSFIQEKCNEFSPRPPVKCGGHKSPVPAWLKHSRSAASDAFQR